MRKCKNAARAISVNTVRNLYGDAAGRCQNPKCLESVLVEALNGARVNVGEMAHIIAASPEGPRNNRSIAPTALAQHGNLLLLCPKCHKVIDTEEDAYPVDLLMEWRIQHENRIAQAFGVHTFKSRPQARAAIDPYMRSNRATFDTFGPLSDSSWNPFSDAVEIWRVRVREVIIPNNRMTLRVLDSNVELLKPDEHGTLELFRIHVEEFERKHLFGVISSSIPMFPAAMNTILED